VRRLCRIIKDADEGISILAALGARVGLSPHYLQLLFTSVMGVSPRQYAEALRRPG
jgi:methylphosphotriester-DNA--protein-cysteine methyltransferase